ncbi:hypothetical protein [Hephaestia mangrovi]|uniref:hypothetical protein n=1 Tax=Hephaestia mangrovi TaxID=2873268 RepID=UPI001CA6E662|nr:hypothetical protein [Hephaestia mangrovi]MBY8827787.1 hypothetical protein [Hephaestia mangrovi]
MTRALLGFAVLTALIPSSVAARDVARSIRQFGRISYNEVVSSRGEGEPAFVGIANTVATLSLNVPTPLAALTIQDSSVGMTIGLRGKQCSTFAGIDGYRDLSIAEISHLLESCDPIATGQTPRWPTHCM